MADAPQTISIPIPGGTLTLSAAFVPTVVTPAPAPAPKLCIGTNVPANDVLTGAAMWCDVTRQMSGWYKAGGATSVTYDANGFPASVTGGGFAASWTYLHSYPSGNYLVAWKGPQAALNVAGKDVSKANSDGQGGWTCAVPFNTGERLELRTTGGITALSILAPDGKGSQTFRDAYLAQLKPYSVIRLMPLQRVNGVGLPPVVKTDWKARVTPSQWDWTSGEVPAEILAELCIEAGCVPWVCIPYGASDEWITGMANAFKGFARSYWEYSNELWNTGPAYQGTQIISDAAKVGKYGPAAQGAAQYHADLTAHMGQLVKAVLPKAKIVLGAQAGWEAWAQNALAWAPKGSIDALAIAPYFQPADGMPVDTIANVAAACQKWIDTTLANGLAKNAAVAKQYGCDFIGYEAGQSLIPNQTNAPPVELQWQADISPTQYAAYRADPARAIQDDPAIGNLYDNLFALCAKAGLSMVCHFMNVSNYGRSGFWGLKQLTTEADGPKGQALARAIAASKA